MNIALYGIYGVYNFGCEAIVRGTVKFINSIYPNGQITYYSYDYGFDKKALSDMNIEIKEIPVKRNFLMRIENKVKNILNAETRILYFDYEKIINEVDMIYSIGGDIYTIPEAVRQTPVYSYYNQLIDFCNRAIDAGKSVVVYGASVGPFGGYKKAVDYYRRNLKRYQMIICREAETIHYLKEIGLQNVCFIPDPAFQVKLPKAKQSEKKYIAINCSPLSFKELYGTVNDSACIKIALLLDQIYEKYHKKLLFIPHVVSKDMNDNDEQFLKKIRAKMQHGGQVKFADFSAGYLGIKQQLRSCYITITARMHCAINSVVENVPPILLSYSQKSISMCEYIYHNTNWVIDLKKLEIDLISTVDKMWNNKEELSDYLIQRNEEINSEYLAKLKEFKETM